MKSKLPFLGLVLSLPLVSQTPVTIMPMGDSITAGVDYSSGSVGGYRDPLATALANAGYSFQFTGTSTEDASPALTSSGNTHHNGFGGWHIIDLSNNLDGSAAAIGGGEPNQGGYLLTGGNGTGRGSVQPNIILLQIGTNDLLQQTTARTQDLTDLVMKLHTMAPNSKVIVAGITPINSANFYAMVNDFNSYIKNTLVPTFSFTTFVDLQADFMNANGTVKDTLIGADLVHPTGAGYALMAKRWTVAIESVLAPTVPAPSPNPAPAPSCPVTPTPTPAPAPAPTSDLGTFSIQNESATQGNALTVFYGKSVDGAQMVSYWAGVPSWKVTAAGSSYTITETAGGRCVTVKGSVSINTCDGSSSQAFGLNAQADGSFVVQNANGSCLQTPDAFQLVGAAACDGSASTKWVFVGSKALVVSH